MSRDLFTWALCIDGRTGRVTQYNRRPSYRGLWKRRMVPAALSGAPVIVHGLSRTRSKS